MNTPCEKTEIIASMSEDVREIKGDVKTLLARHNQSLGEKKLKTRLTKIALELIKIVATVLVTIAGYIKFK